MRSMDPKKHQQSEETDSELTHTKTNFQISTPTGTRLVYTT